MTWRPKLARGARLSLLVRLVANGLAQTGLAVGLAVLTAHMLGVLNAPAELKALGWTAIALLAAGLGTVMLRALQRRDAEALGLSYVRDVQILVFGHLCQLPPDDVRIGPAMTRFTTDLGSIRNWISRGIASVLVAVAALTAGFLTLFFLDWRLAAATLLPFLLCGFVAAAVSVPLLRDVRMSRRLRGRLSGRIGDNMIVRTTLQHLGLVERETKRLEEQTSELDQVLVRRALWAGALRFSVEAIAPAAAALILIFHALGVGAEPLQAAAVASWLFALAVITGPVRDCARAWDYRLAFAEAAKRLDRLFATDPGPPPVQQARRDFPAGGGFSLKEIKLAGRPRRLSFDAPSGNFIAVTGDAQARSDLFGTIAGLSRAEAGTMTLGDVPLSAIAHRHFSCIIGLVSPAVPLVRGSLRRNLARGIEPVDDGDLLAALRQCRLDHAFPEGLDTRIRAGGHGLPPGIRARIALARALLRDPHLLLIDDPVLIADRDGRAVLCDIALARSRVLFAALDEPDLLGQPDKIWALPDNPRTITPQGVPLEASLED